MAVAAALVIGGLPIGGGSPAAAAGFDTRPGSVALGGAGSAFPGVVAAGDGVYHAVSRVDGGVQRIVYRRSEDGGRSWPSAAMFMGPNGGATRPVIAVDGDIVAIAFIGNWCPGDPAPCADVPLLVISTSSGRTWGPVRRLDQQAFTVSVAVDGSQVWVAWDRAGGLEVRGYTSTNQTLAKESVSPAPCTTRRWRPTAAPPWWHGPSSTGRGRSWLATR